VSGGGSSTYILTFRSRNWRMEYEVSHLRLSAPFHGDDHRGKVNNYTVWKVRAGKAWRSCCCITENLNKRKARKANANWTKVRLSRCLRLVLPDIMADSQSPDATVGRPPPVPLPTRNAPATPGKSLASLLTNRAQGRGSTPIPPSLQAKMAAVCLSLLSAITRRVSLVLLIADR